MNYKTFKMRFTTGLRMGDGNLADSIGHIKADTLFSAFCTEAVKTKSLEKLIELSQRGDLLISDTMPYIDDICLIPKPIMYVELEKTERAGGIDKKKLKNLKYIPSDKIDEYLQGNIGDIYKIGYKDTRTLAAISRTGDDTAPYHVGIYGFNPNCGLYFILAYREESGLKLIDDLLSSVSYTGIGGKKSGGLGKFRYEIEDLNPHMEERIVNIDRYNKYMTLSVSLAQEDEMEEVLQGASYLLEKRSGFVYSETFAAEQRKKKDLHVFSSASCFNRRFRGDIYDVAEGGNHKVYRYAKPLFMGMK